MAVSLIIVFAASLGTSLLVTPWIRDLALRWRVGDYPDKRKVHKTFIPRMGGVGIIAGVANYGLFVQLENTAEGLVPSDSMPGGPFRL